MAVVLVGLVATSACDEEPARGPMSSAVTYGNGRFVAVRWQWGTPDTPGWIAIETSVDGDVWREVAGLVAHGNGQAEIVWTGTRFVALISDFASTAYDSALVSDDGELWTPIAAPQEPRSIASSADRTLVVTTRGVAELEGTTWSAPIGEGPMLWSPQIEYLGGRFFVFGDGGVISETVDGRAWISADTRLSSIGSIADLDGSVVAFGTYDCCFGEVPDALQHFRLSLVADAWEILEIESPGRLNAVLDVGPRAVALHWDALSTSDDGGATWVRAREVDFWGRGQLATDGNGTVVATGFEGSPRVSHDFGATWDR